MWSTHYFSENQNPSVNHWNSMAGCKMFGFRCAATYSFICPSDRRWTWAHIQLQADFLQIIGRHQVQSKVFNRCLLFSDQGHKVNSTCWEQVLVPLDILTFSVWPFEASKLFSEPFSIRQFLEGRKVYGTGGAILWHSGIEMFKRRIVAIRQPPRSLGITTL